MAMRVTPLPVGSGVLVHASPGQRLESLSKAQALRMLDHAGLLVLRGFRPTPTEAQALVSAWSSRTIVDVSRPPDPEGHGMQLVDRGMDAMELHAEHGNGPFRPELLWFLCEVPARQGGQTTYCDGVELLEALAEDTVRLLRAQRLLYRVNYPPRAWRALLGEDVPLSVVEARARELDGLSFSTSADGTLLTRYRCSAISRARNGQEALASSIRGPYDNSVVSFEDGSPIPDAVIDELTAAAEPLTGEIDWQPGDLALLDNGRMLHGRRAFHDPARRVYAMLSWS